MHDADIDRQIASVSTQIADTELRIFQHQKRVANLQARGADVSELKSAIAVLTETLIYLESYKAQLHEQSGGQVVARRSIDLTCAIGRLFLAGLRTAASNLSTGRHDLGKKPASGCNTLEYETKDIPHPDLRRSATII